MSKSKVTLKDFTILYICPRVEGENADMVERLFVNSATGLKIAAIDLIKLALLAVFKRWQHVWLLRFTVNDKPCADIEVVASRRNATLRVQL